MKKIILALDCSPHSRRAAEYVAAVAPNVPGCEVLLFSVLTGVPFVEGAQEGEGPPELHGDEDHIREREQVETFLDGIRSLLEEGGLGGDRISIAAKPLRRGIVQDILDEAETSACDTIVVGRRGHSKVREMFLGSVSSDLVHRAAPHTVWVVE